MRLQHKVAIVTGAAQGIGRAAAILAIALLGFHAAPVFAEPFDLRGIRLGITVDEFKKLPHPDSDKYPGSSALCGEEVKRAGRMTLYDPTEQETATKSFRCNWFTQLKREFGQFDLFTPPLGILDKNVSTTLFYFIVPGTGQQPRLMRMTFFSSNAWFSKLATALREKWGPPTKSETGQVQNRLGARFENQEYQWERDSSSISLTQHTSNIDEMRLTYLHKSLSMIWYERLREFDKQKAKKL